MGRRGVLCLFTVALSLLGAHSAQAKISHDSLLADMFARQAHDLSFASRLDRDAQRVQIDRARFTLDMTRRLYQKAAGSAFDYSNAIVNLARHQLLELRSASLMIEFGNTEKVYEYKSSVEQGARKEDLVEFATLMVTLRKDRHDTIKKLVEQAAAPAKEMEYQYRQMQNLYARRAISLDDLDAQKALYRDAVGLVKLANDELVETERRLKDAELALTAAKKQVREDKAPPAPPMPQAESTGLPVPRSQGR